MFRCDNCGSGYSSQAASSLTSCPRCMAKDRIQVPLAFELGWHGGRKPDDLEVVEGEHEGQRAEAA